MPNHPPLPTVQALRAELRGYDLQKLATAGLRRDPGTYNLMVHIVPPEVARDDVATEALRDRLAQPPGPICLYLHVAPCTGRCTFCHYAITVNPDDSALDRYMAALHQEMTLRWSALDARSPVSSVLVGGGTPTYLSARQLDAMLSHLRKTVHLAPGIEMTLESSPETLTPEKLAVLRDHGVDRLSIGIQAFDDGLLRSLGRRHDRRGALDAIAMARNAGFAHVNIDLIYALPGQSVDGWLRDVSLAADAGVDSLTTYHLRKRPDTVISRHASPDEADNLVMHLGALEVLAARGYRQSLADYFCKEALPTAQVQARDKWRDMVPVDGCGLEACSRRPDTVAFDHADFMTYIEAMERGDGPGGWPLAHGRFLSIEEQMAQRAMFALKVLDDDGGLDPAKFAKEFGRTVSEAFGDLPERLLDLGMLQERDARLHLTRLGTLLSDEVCQQFYTEDLRRKMTARVQVRAAGDPVPLPRGTAGKALATADVIVVGAGVAGLATAVRLAADLGVGVLVCDAEPLAGSGATSASLGGFRTQFEDAVLATLSARSLPAYEHLAAGEDGEAVGLRRSGYLFLATSEADEAFYARQAAQAHLLGEPVTRLNPAQAAELVQGMRVDDLLSAWWGPRDGQVDPHGLVRLWLRRLAALGARVQLGTRVTGLRVSKGRVLGVETAAGWLGANHVVLAAGAATGELLRTAGVDLPLEVARRRMVLAQGSGLPSVAGPLVLSRDPPLYFRAESTGLLLSARELSNDAAGNWLAVAAERTVHRLPGMANARFREAWSGLQTHTPDGRPFVGPCPGLDGLLLVAGLGGTGVMHAPALAEVVAACLHGNSEDPLAAALDPRRVALLPKGS